MGEKQVPDETDVARAIERLRLAESRLSRRRQTKCGPSESARAAMRFILERADQGERVTPSAIAAHVGVTAATVTGMLDKLHGGGLIAFEPHPDDRRSKLVVPFDRSGDADAIDPVTARVRDLADGLSPAARTEVLAFLSAVTDHVDQECAA